MLPNDEIYYIVHFNNTDFACIQNFDFVTQSNLIISSAGDITEEEPI